MFFQLSTNLLYYVITIRHIVVYSSLCSKVELVNSYTSGSSLHLKSAQIQMLEDKISRRFPCSKLFSSTTKLNEDKLERKFFGTKIICTMIFLVACFVKRTNDDIRVYQWLRNLSFFIILMLEKIYNIKDKYYIKLNE